MDNVEKEATGFAIIAGIIAALFVAVTQTGCSTGAEFRIGWTPISAIEHTQKFEAEGSEGLLVGKNMPKQARY